jgi:hypothetical protein
MIQILWKRERTNDVGAQDIFTCFQFSQILIFVSPFFSFFLKKASTALPLELVGEGLRQLGRSPKAENMIRQHKRVSKL